MSLEQYTPRALKQLSAKLSTAGQTITIPRTKKPRPPKDALPASFRPPYMVERRLLALGIAKKHAWITKNTGRELGAIAADDLTPCREPVTSASGFELLGSYNWRFKRPQARLAPHIFVPGEAPRVVPHRLPHVTRVKPRGRNFRDVNAAYMPCWPFEPMFSAVGVMRPDFRFDDVDMVINRSSLSHLLRFGT